MTSAVSSNAPRAPGPNPARGGHQVQPSTDDIHAMRQALAAAHARPQAAQTPPQPGGKARPQGSPTKSEVPKHAGRSDGARADTGDGRAGEAANAEADPLVRERDMARDEGRGNGLAFTGQPAAAPAPVEATPPAPHVDASAFAQLMTQLWIREKDKGSKEIRVAFGDGSWPATGARLVRNEGGSLDIQLFVSNTEAGGYEARLDGLRERFRDNGVAVGALEVSGET